MGDYQELEKICVKLVSIPLSQWKEEKVRIYTNIGEIGFYLSARLEKEIDHQDRVLVGEGENSEVVDLKLPITVRYVKLEIKDLVTNRIIESYEQRNDLPLSLYKTVTEGIEKLSSEWRKQKEERELEEGRKKLKRILA